jgi:hypothetical protein
MSNRKNIAVRLYTTASGTGVEAARCERPRRSSPIDFCLSFLKSEMLLVGASDALRA